MSGLGLAKKLVRVSQEELCTLLEKFEAQHSLDLGATLLHTGRHEVMGLMMLASDISGGGAYLSL